MRKTAILVLLFLFLGINSAFSQEVKTIKGEVIDASCYVIEGARGQEHKDCAIACINAGEPAGILDEQTGKIYIVVTDDHSGPAAKILPYVAKTVEAKGKVYERGGVSAIVIEDIQEIGAAEAGKAGESMGMSEQGMDMGMPKEKMREKSMTGY